METENPEIPKETLIGWIKKRRMKKQTPFAQCPLNKFLHNISFILIRNNTACSNKIFAVNHPLSKASGIAVDPISTNIALSS